MQHNDLSSIYLMCNEPVIYQGKDFFFHTLEYKKYLLFFISLCSETEHVSQSKGVMYM